MTCPAKEAQQSSSSSSVYFFSYAVRQLWKGQMIMNRQSPEADNHIPVP